MGSHIALDGYLQVNTADCSSCLQLLNGVGDGGYRIS
jgi:hypothetical protein